MNRHCANKITGMAIYLLTLVLFLLVWVIIAYSETDQDQLLQLESQILAQKENGIIVQYKDNIPAVKRLNKITWPTAGDSPEISPSPVAIQEISPTMELITADQGVDMACLMEELKKDDSVLYVEVDKEIKLYGQPNDPYYYQQWGLKNIMAEEAWEVLPPAQKTVVVAVVDSGVETSHLDLRNRIAPGGYNFLTNDNNVTDINGHGTAVAGVIAAETDNNIGIAGVAGHLDVEILPLKTAAYNGTSRLSDVVRAIDYAIEHRVDVINISMGSDGYSNIEKDAVMRAVRSGIVVVAAAGNEGISRYNYPASYDDVISVGSISDNNIVSAFSNYNDKIDFVGPGEDIYSCQLNNSYTTVRGTSFSAPAVSGAVAVLKAMNPLLSPKEALGIMQANAVDLGPAGRDHYYGYGAVNLYHIVRQLAYVAVTGVVLNKNSIILTVGKTETLSATVLPTNASQKDITWVSDNPDVAVVDRWGTVTAVGVGEATIIVITEDGGKTATCSVIVGPPVVPVSGVSLSLKNLVITKLGATYPLNALVEPADATNKKVFWYTNDQKVITVNADGLIVAVGPGNATIKVITEDGGFDDFCSVIVKESPDPVFDGREWLAQTNVATDKAWTIQFNQPVDANSLGNQSIYVEDDFGNRLETRVVLGGDEKSCTMVPVHNYRAGQVYFLVIGKDVCSAKGKCLSDSYKMKFTIRH